MQAGIEARGMGDMGVAICNEGTQGISNPLNGFR
jgi:hypothetical protein